MDWPEKSPVFTSVLIGLGLVTLAEAWGLSASCVAAHDARTRLDRASHELRALSELRPSPTVENAGRIEAELTLTRRTLATVLADLQPPEPIAAQLRSTRGPGWRPDAFFDIAAFVEEMHLVAQRAGVVLRPDERFSFSSYANEAPEPGRIATVYRERLILQHLLEALTDAHPYELLAVQRERPRAPDGHNESIAGGAGKNAADYFELDSRISLRVPGVVETTAFRLAFTGHTAVLRNWLNRLAKFDLPVVVRAIEVAPAEATPSRPVSATPTSTPLVAPALSRFTVTVEYLDPAALADSDS